MRSAALARRFDARHIERDQLGTLGSVEAEVYAAAQAVIWLDYRRSLILARAIRRALRRTVGTLEPGQTFADRFRQWIAPVGPRFLMAVYDERRHEFGRLHQHPILADIPVLRFATPTEAAMWFAALAPHPPPRNASSR